jgi:hypothetical protein
MGPKFTTETCGDATWIEQRVYNYLTQFIAVCMRIADPSVEALFS